MRDWKRLVGPGLAWGLVAGVVVFLAGRLAEQEYELVRQAEQAVEQAERLERAWQDWDGRMAPRAELWSHLPGEPAAGRALVRFILSTRAGITELTWDRVSSLPVLVETWYEGVPASQFLEGEIALLAWIWLPLWEGAAAEPGLTVDTGVALSSVLREEVERRCPSGCPPLSGADPDALRQQLVAALDSPRTEKAMTALTLLIRGGEEAIPGVRARLEAGGPCYGQALAFLALTRLLPLPERRALIQRSLSSTQPGVRLLAALEAVRLLDASLLPEVRAISRVPEPPGAGVLALLAERILEQRTRGLPASESPTTPAIRQPP